MFGSRQVQFEISDIMTVELEDEAYDVIYSRDSILFIREKYELFKKLFVSVIPYLHLYSITLLHDIGLSSIGYLTQQTAGCYVAKIVM